MWRLEKFFDVNLYSQLCVYWTISAYTPPTEPPGACSALGYRIDLYDKAFYVNAGAANEAYTLSKGTDTHKFALSGVTGDLGL